MNHTVKDEIPNARVQIKERKASVFLHWLPLVLFPLYSLLKYGLGGRTEDFFLSVFGLSLSYPLGIFVYYQVIQLAFRKRIKILVMGMVLAASLASILAPHSKHLEMTIELLMITTVGTIIGRTALFEKSQFKLFIYGLIPLIIGALVMYLPVWPEAIRVISSGFESSSGEIEAWFITTGYSAAQASEYTVQTLAMLKQMVRLLPAMTILNLMIPMVVGFIWFMSSSVSNILVSGRLKPFNSWKVPFVLTPVLIVVIMFKLIGTETIELIADNCLAIISVFFTVGGLALIQFMLKKLKFSIGSKIIFFLMLSLLGEYGYLLMSLLGFVDSFADWRKKIAVT